MSNKLDNTIEYTQTNYGTKYHIRGINSVTSSLCGAWAPTGVSPSYTPFRADVCKTCKKIHDKRTS